ncbi:hypothetical protein [Streptomyces salinarius]|uniref:hypothetical protein n=1 Tax=Streptomyces salinarius TaxID=2762598 RepID=UPI0016464E07|nr:hypothetical protein [Streptomyces salinarius]
MGFFERLTGTRYPASGVAPLAVAEVRDVLLAVNGPGVPYRVRLAGSGEKGDVVADWRISQRSFGQQGDQRLTLRMLLDPGRHEVRVLQEQWTKTGEKWSASRGYGRGGGFSVEWTYERGPDGRRRRVNTLDTREMSRVLRQSVLSAGWSWRPRRLRL